MVFWSKIGLFAVFLGVAVCAAAATPTIELKDGSRIQGDVQDVENGSYRVSSPSLGTVHIPQASIARITYEGAPDGAGSTASATRNDALASEVQQAQAALARDPATLQTVMGLQSDPQIQAILSDPTVMKQIQEQDYAALIANPKIQALEHNEKIQALVQQQAH